jgi:prepilin-type N-terminal cleavage/methylation domain-containing protein
MMRRSLTKNRRAFTLIETIVTVGILSVLAAFVVPTVIQKSGVGDPVKLTNDLNAIRTGLDNFANDTKAGYPNQILELTSKPTTTSLLIDNTTTLTSTAISFWNGPYISATIGANSLDSIPTGYTAFIGNRLERYDLVNNIGELDGGTGTTYSAANTNFVAIKITGLNATQAATINKMIDGPDDLNVASGLNVGANTTGRFRFDPPNASHIVIAYFMASPIT